MERESYLTVHMWDNYKKKCRKILVAMMNASLFFYAEYNERRSDSDASWKSMEAEIESLLKRLLAVNDSMSRITSEGAITTSVTQKLARHRDILHEFNQVIFHCIELNFL